MPEFNWTALKITSHRRFSDSAEDCVVIEEIDRHGESDTSRFLKAGARRAIWIQANRIEAAIPEIKAVITPEISLNARANDVPQNQITKPPECSAICPYVVIEGNSVLDFFDADFSILVLNAGVAEFKKSAHSILTRADALVIIRENAVSPDWENLVESTRKNTPLFETNAPGLFPPSLTELLRSRFRAFQLPSQTKFLQNFENIGGTNSVETDY